MLKQHGMNILLVGPGDACGALLRHGTNHLVGWIGTGEPLITATTIENLLGSYTIYSGFMAEALMLYFDAFPWFVVDLFGQVFFGVAALLAGMRIAENIYGIQINPKVRYRPLFCRIF